MNGVHLFTLAAILDNKCGSVAQRSSESKRATDIVFILRLIIAREMRFDPNEVSSATEDLQNALEHHYHGIKQFFQAVGLEKRSL